MSSEDNGTSGQELEIVGVDKPILATFVGISKALLGGRTFWRRTDSPVDTSIH